MNKFKMAAVMLAGGCALAASGYDVRFKNIYQSRMVLQAGKPNDVAGRANPGAAITVTGEAVKPGRAPQMISLHVKADSSGRWTVTLPALPK